MVTMYVADGLRAPAVNVEVFVEASQQVLMKLLYVTVLYDNITARLSNTVSDYLFNHSVN